MKKALIIVGALVVLGAIVVGAFAGGLVIGRVTNRPAVAVEATMGPVEQVPSETPLPTDVPETSNPGDEEEVEPSEPAPTAPESDLENDASDEQPPAEAFDYELLREVLEILEEQYYGEIPDGEELAYGAVRGMLLTLDDPYTSFVEPEITAIINEDASGEYEGIGAMVTMRDDGYLEVTSLIPDQPAEAAGVKAGDIIVAVGDQSIVGLGLYEAISYIRGPAGTDAELEILRASEPDSVYITVTRARIETPIVETEILENDIAYLRLTEFDATAGERVENALEELLAEDPEALVFDLRNNPGGWLSQAIAVADVFLDEGLVAIQRDSMGNEQRYPSEDGDLGESIPMVVLINRGSASASEIVAGALQDRDRAPLIGTQTLGKGSVQLPNNLENGAQLRVTIARWFTPDEQELHNNGLTPDIVVEVEPDTPVEEDPQLDRALEYLGEEVDGNN
jgi:carboxyl-terminal processing protease